MMVESQFEDVPRHLQVLIFKQLIDVSPVCYFETLSSVCKLWHSLVREAVTEAKTIRTLEQKEPSNAVKLSTLLQMLPYCHSLETLDLTALYVAGMDPRHDILRTLSQHCPCLHTLILDSSSRIVTPSTLQKYLDTKPKQLAVLSLNSCPDIVQDGWPLQNIAYLTRLELKWCHGLVKLPQNLKNLVHLNIAGCAALPSNESQRIGMEATNLQYINFAFVEYHTTSTTGLSHIFKVLKGLKELVLAKAVGNVWSYGGYLQADVDALTELLPEMHVKFVTT